MEDLHQEIKNRVENLLPAPDEEYKIGKDYYDGIVVPQDYSKALNWLRRSAGKNHAEAQYLMGIMYLRGLGVEANSAEAKKWFSQAAANQHKDAVLELERLATESQGKK